MLDAYRYALSQIELYGPTNFSSFLDRAINMAKGKVTQQSQSYHILLVITVRGWSFIKHASGRRNVEIFFYYLCMYMTQYTCGVFFVIVYMCRMV